MEIPFVKIQVSRREQTSPLRRFNSILAAKFDAHSKATRFSRSSGGACSRSPREGSSSISARARAISSADLGYGGHSKIETSAGVGVGGIRKTMGDLSYGSWRRILARETTYLTRIVHPWRCTVILRERLQKVNKFHPRRNRRRNRSTFHPLSVFARVYPIGSLSQARAHPSPSYPTLHPTPCFYHRPRLNRGADTSLFRRTLYVPCLGSCSQEVKSRGLFRRSQIAMERRVRESQTTKNHPPFEENN